MAATAVTLQGEAAMGEVVAMAPVVGMEVLVAMVGMQEDEVATEEVVARVMAADLEVLEEMEDTGRDVEGMGEKVEMAKNALC
ncbi:MAG: hypothetical protein P4N59_05375 [Negativicutes bacterium]|nr:hypothetical protein [Negativicutes bacterium]